MKFLNVKFLNVNFLFILISTLIFITDAEEEATVIEVEIPEEDQIAEEEIEIIVTEDYMQEPFWPETEEDCVNESLIPLMNFEAWDNQDYRDVKDIWSTSQICILFVNYGCKNKTPQILDVLVILIIFAIFTFIMLYFAFFRRNTSRPKMGVMNYFTNQDISSRNSEVQMTRNYDTMNEVTVVDKGLPPPSYMNAITGSSVEEGAVGGDVETGKLAHLPPNAKTLLKLQRERNNAKAQTSAAQDQEAGLPDYVEAVKLPPLRD